MATQQPVPGTQTGLIVGEIEELADAATTRSRKPRKGDGYIPPKRPFNFNRWFRATGWRVVWSTTRPSTVSLHGAGAGASRCSASRAPAAVVLAIIAATPRARVGGRSRGRGPRLGGQP